VDRKLPGKRVGGRCVRRTKANRRRRSCTRYVGVRGSFDQAGQTSSNSLRFRGRLAGQRLKPGSYRLNATLPSGRVRRASFTVKKP
jgi:hypothetical protein